MAQLPVFHTLRRKPSSLATIKGWFDDSERAGVCALGGYAGADHRWEYFDFNWPIVLAKHGVPYLHMKETHEPKGPYAKWLPAQNHRDEWVAFLRELAEAIHESRLIFFGSIVWLSHLERFNRERGMNLQPYSLATCACMDVVEREYGMETTELFFDPLPQVKSKLDLGQEYAKSDPNRAGCYDRMLMTPLGKGISWKDLPALQAADFMTWEFRKYQEGLGAWFDLPDRPKDEDEHWAQMEAWLLSNEIVPRKSAAALVEGNQVAPFIWDYNRLCEADQARGGKWK